MNFDITFRSFMAVLVGSLLSHAAKLEEPQNYGPKFTPDDAPQTRQLLGYNKYEKQPVESSHSSVSHPFGNNWEQFTIPDINYNFRFSGKPNN